MITTVEIRGALIDPCYVLARVQILHGRPSVTEGPTASVATITIHHPAGPMPSWASGDLIRLADPAGDMFTGRITDRSLEHVTEAGAVVGAFTITATGTVARLGLRQVGATPWPTEAGSARAARILTEAGVPYLIDGATDATILARDVDARTALDLLTELQTSTSAAVFDLPDGRVVYQPLSGRARPVFPFRWQDFDAALTWADFDPALTWAGDPPSIESWISPGSTFPVALPCEAVAWEPVWTATAASIVNHVRVGWGPKPDGGDQPYVEVRDDASIARHGARYLYQSTDLATAGGALAHASRILAVNARERWNLGAVTVLLGRLDEPTYAAVLRLTAGRHVRIDNLPQPAPAALWTGILEGWTYTQTGDVETLVLALSDPLASLAVMRWADYPALFRWDDHPGWLTWDDLNDLDAMEVAA